MIKSWIPNGLSLGNLTFGFLSILVVSHANTTSRYEPHEVFFLGSIFILIAALFDGLDGPLARKLSAESAIGEQLDSLADLTTFGLAPGFLMYHVYFSAFNISFKGYDYPIGMAVSAIYPMCAAYRLARFNVSHDPKTFLGLPSPIAGIFIALIPLICQNYKMPLWSTVSIFLIISLLMVSNIRYSKPTRGLTSKITIYRLITAVILISFLILWLGWYWVVFSIIVLYIFSGFLAFFLLLIQKIRIGSNH
ncbi:MAG: CDP-diacylglycerol--serine O-phosphatidyltransferase [Spirochaetia bacterium]|nr:CDP-diacylglycerol--serine O-phosphatidyltransferase [Spirochaetia bacterium]